MDLFLETPQQQAERMLRQQQRLMEMQMQGVAAQPPAQNATPAVSPAGGSAPENYSVQQDSYAQVHTDIITKFYRLTPLHDR